MAFLSYFLQLLLCALLPLLLLGLLSYALHRLFSFLVGEGSGRPLLLLTSALSVPLREAGHAVACLLFFHRITDICLINLHSPDGELGFVEHSYNPRNPIARMGNFFFALAPALMGLLAVFLILLLCFDGVILTSFERVAVLEEAGAGLDAYMRELWQVPIRLFTEGRGTAGKILGCLLLLLVARGVHISLEDLWEARLGLGAASVCFLIFVGLSALFDDRLRRIILQGFHTFAFAVTALFLVALLASAVLLLLGGAFYLARRILALDRER